MGKVISLNKVRKQKTREAIQAAKAKAAPVSGIKKPERDRVVKMNNISDDRLDGHKRDD